MDRYIVTLSGERVSLEHGMPTLHDIAVASCRIPMYAGATRKFQSLAHHCIGAAMLAEENNASTSVILFTLLHEVEVAVFGDIPGPVKCRGQREVEKPVRARIWANLVGRQPTDAEWELVEYWDKIEQAAAASWLTLPEPVHAAIWDSTGPVIRDSAIKISAQLYQDYPPEMQLVVTPMLADRFTQIYYRCITSVDMNRRK